MIFLFLLPPYLAVVIYMLVRFFHWLKNCHHRLAWKRVKIPFTVVYILLALSPIVAFFLPKSSFAVIVRRVSTYWMGVLLYSAIAVGVLELLRLIAKHTKLRNTKLFSRGGTITVGSIITVVTALVCVWGGINARNIRVTDYSVSVNKKCEGTDKLNIVLVADLHMGYSIGVKHIEKMVDRINEQEPDLVVIAGDIFDNSYDSLDDPEGIRKQFLRINSKYGVYATMGNHDIEEKILMGFTFSWGESPKLSQQMQDYVENCGIKVLYDESVLVDNKFYIVGRRDRDKPGTDDGSRASIGELTKDLDKSKPVFVIAHEPDELQQTADAGADIDLSGHTHDGQLFPLTLVVRNIWENPCGKLEKDNMTSIVTSGVGVYGPFMRVGTRAEICNITVEFNG